MPKPLPAAEPDRHASLQRRYEELVSKYRSAVETRTQSHWLGSWLLHHARDGVALVRGGQIAAANRCFYELCAGRRGWVCTSDADVDGTTSLVTSLTDLACRLSAEAGAQRAYQFRSGAPTVCYLDAEFQRLDPTLDDVAIVLRDRTESELLREQSEESRRRDQFLATLAHELRNPLSPMLSAAELILQTDDPERAREAALTIRKQVEHQARLVEDLLDVARVRQGKVHLRRDVLDLREPLREAVRATNEAREHRLVHLECALPEEPVWVLADPDRMVQCAVNLLVNAAKYTQPGGTNWLQLRCQGDSACFQVRDNGMGIRAELLDRVFEVFTQADRSLDRSGGGLGLGLSLVKTLAEMHGGSVRAFSAGEGRGSAFEVWLPLSPPPSRLMTAAAEPARPNGALAAPRRVLVVDDNEDACSTLGELLEEAGYQVLTAADGPAALACALREHPDAVVTDIGLPGMDGWELAEKLRHALPETRLIAVSGYSPPAEGAERFDGYLVKPVAFPALLSQLEG